MLFLACVLFPPVLLIALRHHWCNDGFPEKRGFLVEYVITWLFFTMLCLGILVLVFKHVGGLQAAFDGYTDFAFHYLCLSVFLAVFIPIIEQLFRKKINFELQWKHKSNNKIITVILWLSALFFAGLHIARCLDNSLWGDEAFSAILARLSFQDMLTKTASDVHPPLYYLFMQFIYRLWGDSGFLYHFLSVIPYLLLLLIGLTYVRKNFGNVACAVFITFTSLSNSAIVYNIEIRMYSWANLFVFVSFLFLYEIIDKNHILSYLCFLFFSLLAAYTHYYALLAAALLYLLLLLRMIFIKKNRAITLGISFAAILGYMPWLTIFLRAFSRTSKGWWLNSIPSVKDCFYFVYNVSNIPYMLPFIIFVFLLFLLYESKTIIVKENKKEEGFPPNVTVTISNPSYGSKKFIFLLAGVFTICGVCIIGLVLSHLIRPLFITRYLFPITAIAYLIFGIALSKTSFRKIWCILLVSILVISGLKYYASIYKSDKALDQSTTEFTQNLHFDEDDCLLSNIPHHAWTILNYYYPNADTHLVDDTNIDFKQYNDKEIWILWSKELPEDVQIDFQKKGYHADYSYAGKIGSDTTMVYIYHVTRGNEQENK